ncbi:hypothetical protein GCM10027568_02930 [Humibacter soli]
MTDSGARQEPAKPAPMSSKPVLTLALRDGGIFAGVVAVIAGLIGYLVDGTAGLYGGLLGAATAAVFLGLTAGSMLVAGKIAKGDQTSPKFFAIIFVTWVVKLILFIVLLLLLGRQTWLDGRVFFITVVIAVIGSLVIDCLAFLRARVPYVDVTLPGAAPTGESGEGTSSEENPHP